MARAATTTDVFNAVAEPRRREIREIVPNERLVHTEVFEGAPGGEPALVTVTFAEPVPGRTTLTMLMELPSREVRDAILESGMEGGLQESLEMLELVARSLA